MKILSPEQIYQADKITHENQKITSLNLMERAGIALTNRIRNYVNRDQKIHIFCGVGNNGGDGLVMGRLLLQQEFEVQVYIVEYSTKYSDEMKENLSRFSAMSENITYIRDDSNFPELSEREVLIDGIFGIGLNRIPDSWVKDLIVHLNKSEATKIAIDIPSGLFANIPISDPEAVLIADLVLALQFPKMAFFLPQHIRFLKAYEVLDINLDSDYISKVDPIAVFITKDRIQQRYRPRGKFGHKGKYGHTLIIGGSYGKIGSVVLAAQGAMRIGAGLVTVFSPSCGYEILQISAPEAMVLTDTNREILTEIIPDFSPDSIAVGMGMGTEEETIKAFREFLKTNNKPIVIDADGLNSISKNPDLLELLPKNSILTPHPGELKRLIGDWKNDYEKLEKARNFIQKNDLILIIKGAYSTILSGKETYINSTGNPGMGTGGTGDVLSGIVAGLLSQHYDPLSAAILGVYLHGLAGDLAAEELTMEAMTAKDLIAYLPKAYGRIHSSSKK